MIEYTSHERYAEVKTTTFLTYEKDMTCSVNTFIGLSWGSHIRRDIPITTNGTYHVSDL